MAIKALTLSQRKPRRPFDPRSNAASRGYDSSWTRLSRQFRAANPLCERCAAEGTTTVADLVHHKVPVEERPDLRLDWNNLESICRTHHAREHVGKIGVMGHDTVTGSAGGIPHFPMNDAGSMTEPPARVDFREMDGGVVNQ